MWKVGSLPANFTMRQTRTPSISEIRWHSNAFVVAGSGLAPFLEPASCGAPCAPGGAGLPVVAPGARCVGMEPRARPRPDLRRDAVAMVR